MVSGQYVYVDRLTHSFVSDGNIFLKFAFPSGEVNPDGSDILIHAVTLVLPQSKLAKMAENVAIAATAHAPMPGVDADGLDSVGAIGEQDGKASNLGAAIPIPL